MEVNEAHVHTLLNMGFPSETDIRHALRFSKNDLNDAVAYLTDDHSTTNYDHLETQLQLSSLRTSPESSLVGGGGGGDQLLPHNRLSGLDFFKPPSEHSDDILTGPEVNTPFYYHHHHHYFSSSPFSISLSLT